MKRFKVVNQKMQFMDDYGNRKYDTIIVTLHKPPYENENVLHKTGYKEKDCKITELFSNISLYGYMSINNEYEETEGSLMGLRPKKIKKSKGKK